jgi:hypothetical protein
MKLKRLRERIKELKKKRDFKGLDNLLKENVSLHNEVIKRADEYLNRVKSVINN